MAPYYNMASTSLPSSYVCDTLPAARLASGASDPELQLEPPSPSPPNAFELTEAAHMKEEEILPESSGERDASASSQPPARKLCVRHQRMADEGTNLKLQQVSWTSYRLLEVFLYNVWLFLTIPDRSCAWSNTQRFRLTARADGDRFSP